MTGLLNMSKNILGSDGQRIELGKIHFKKIIQLYLYSVSEQKGGHWKPNDCISNYKIFSYSIL